MVDPQGRDANKALLITELNTRIHVLFNQHSFWMRQVRNGRFELSGCDPNQSRRVFFLDREQQLGATIVLDPRNTQQQPTVRLQPCGSATVRLLDAEGQPRVNELVCGGKRGPLADMLLVAVEVQEDKRLMPRRPHLCWFMVSDLDEQRYAESDNGRRGPRHLPYTDPGRNIRAVRRQVGSRTSREVLHRETGTELGSWRVSREVMPRHEVNENQSEELSHFVPERLPEPATGG